MMLRCWPSVESLRLGALQDIPEPDIFCFEYGGLTERIGNRQVLGLKHVVQIFILPHVKLATIWFCCGACSLFHGDQQKSFLFQGFTDGFERHGELGTGEVDQGTDQQ